MEVDKVDKAVHALNHPPRKCLQYRTPHGVFLQDKSSVTYTMKTRTSHLNLRV